MDEKDRKLNIDYGTTSRIVTGPVPSSGMKIIDVWVEYDDRRKTTHFRITRDVAKDFINQLKRLL